MKKNKIKKFNYFMILFTFILVLCILLWSYVMATVNDSPDNSSTKESSAKISSTKESSTKDTSKKSSSVSNTTTQNMDNNLIITNLDVGKADSCVIQYHDITGIIDTGTKDQYDTIHDFLDENGIDSLDFLILTHYDKDHIGSAKKIIKHYNISQIITPDYVSSKKYYAPLQGVLQDKDNVDYISEDDSYQFDNIKLEVIPTSNEKEMEREPDSYDNNMSLVVMMTFGMEKMLFTGDIEGLRTEQLLADGYNLDADWIKMPHHGRYESEQEELLEAVTPQYAVISTSDGQPADAKELTMLKDDSIPYFITSDGNVVTTSDGLSIHVTQ